MKKLKILALTDHLGHSKENALYPLLRSLADHPSCEKLEVATRGIPENEPFFKAQLNAVITISQVDRSFQFTPEGSCFKTNQRVRKLADYDAIWLRLPPIISPVFLSYLSSQFKGKIINDPLGILTAGSKEFLLNFPDITPKCNLITSLSDIESMRAITPLVLKPLRAYGGKGIVRIDKDLVWLGTEKTTFSKFASSLLNTSFPFLGMEYLQNVGQGDKRIVVVDGNIMGAALRLPAEGSWLCNVAAGGTSVPSEVDLHEMEIVKTVDPVMKKLGIVMYGIDTLMGNHGKRVLSELNVTSIGGLPQIEQMNKTPLVSQAIDLIINKMK